MPITEFFGPWLEQTQYILVDHDTTYNLEAVDFEGPIWRINFFLDIYEKKLSCVISQKGKRSESKRNFDVFSRIGSETSDDAEHIRDINDPSELRPLIQAACSWIMMNEPRFNDVV